MRTFRKAPDFSVGRNGAAGFSLVEIIVVIGVIAILAAISIPVMTGVVGGARDVTAGDNLERLNQAVLKYNHANSELTNAVNSGISDEQSVFVLLKTRDAAIPGTPFLEPHLVATSSSDSTTHRAKWNGRMFEMVEPGTVGTGVNLAKLFGP